MRARGALSVPDLRSEPPSAAIFTLGPPCAPRLPRRDWAGVRAQGLAPFGTPVADSDADLNWELSSEQPESYAPSTERPYSCTKSSRAF
jgi:hypothetical protein